MVCVRAPHRRSTSSLPTTGNKEHEHTRSSLPAMGTRRDLQPHALPEPARGPPPPPAHPSPAVLCLGIDWEQAQAHGADGRGQHGRTRAPTHDRWEAVKVGERLRGAWWPGPGGIPRLGAGSGGATADGDQRREGERRSKGKKTFSCYSLSP
jgi:hypothetical protein